MTRRIVLCADDYGQAPPISEAIIRLLEKQRLTAVSCLVNAPYWREHANWLKPFSSQVDVGLHFNLTEGHALSSEYTDSYGSQLSSLPHVIFKSLMGRYTENVIIKELQAQLAMFVAEMGRLPDFIDGHQHVHQFPIIRKALLSVYRELGKPAYLRLVNPKNILTDPKKMVLHFIGGRAFEKCLRIEDIPHNLSFSGIYSFANALAYPKLFPIFLQESADRGLIMCHPGLANKDPLDVIAQARFHEYQYLSSDQFLEDSVKIKYTQFLY